MAYYNIVRFYKTGRRRLIDTGVTLKQAKEHCNDPKTRKAGVWFDGFEECKR